MLLFSSSNFNDHEVDYLSFSEDFKIDVKNEKIKIILGPNGMGKSSIYRNIQSRFPNYSYIDYNEVENAMLKNKDTLIIASRIATIESKNKEIQSIFDNANIKKTMADSFELSSKAKCEKISANLNEYRNDSYKAFKKFDINKLNVLFELDDSLKDFVIKYGRKLIEQTIAEASIEEIKDDYKKKYLEMVDKCLTEDEYICPVCGSECEEPIKQIINRKISEITESTNEIVKDYIANNREASPNTVLEKINQLKNTIIQKEISIDNLEDYIICGGDEEKAKYIIENKNRVEQLKNEIDSLENDRLEFYNNIRSIEDRIRGVFESQLEIPHDNIIFDDEQKILKVKLDRNISQYSTGEVNLITFIVTLLEFINSDRDTLVIDDPLSSYDIPNQYKIMYEITNVNSNKTCNILVLTHNIDCINIAHSQHKGAYEIMLMDEVNGKLYLNSIDRLGDNGFNIEYIVNNLVGRENYNYTEYIKYLFEKDCWDEDDPKHQLFHYDALYTLPNSTCNNAELSELIDNLNENDIENMNSIINSANKILYLAALRIWIEKQFYDNTNDAVGLRGQKCLGNKIRFMLDENHWNGQAQIKKDFLMSKKVMLNQNDHAKGQKEPFYYALSISTDDIIKEIIQIKNHFQH